MNITDYRKLKSEINKLIKKSNKKKNNLNLKDLKKDLDKLRKKVVKQMGGKNKINKEKLKSEINQGMSLTRKEKAAKAKAKEKEKANALKTYRKYMTTINFNNTSEQNFIDALPLNLPHREKIINSFNQLKDLHAPITNRKWNSTDKTNYKLEVHKNNTKLITYNIRSNHILSTTIKELYAILVVRNKVEYSSHLKRLLNLYHNPEEMKGHHRLRRIDTHMWDGKKPWKTNDEIKIIFRWTKDVLVELVYTVTDDKVNTFSLKKIETSKSFIDEYQYVFPNNNEDIEDALTKLIILSKRLIGYVNDKTLNTAYLYKIIMLEKFIRGTEEKRELMRKLLDNYTLEDIREKPFKMMFMSDFGKVNNGKVSLFSLIGKLIK